MSDYDPHHGSTRKKRINLPEDSPYGERLDVLNVSLKLKGVGVYCGFQKWTQPRVRWGTIIPVVEPGRLSDRPWGLWSEGRDRRMSSFATFEKLEANIRDKMGL